MIDLSNPREIPRGENVPRTVNLRKSVNGIPIQFIGPSTAEVVLHLTPEHQVEMPVNLMLEVPVTLLIEPELMERITNERFVLSRDETFPQEWKVNVTLSGTAKRLGQIKAGDIVAFVRVTDGELLPAQTHPERDVEFLLPDGVTIEKPKAATVHFKFAQPAAQP